MVAVPEKEEPRFMGENCDELDRLMAAMAAGSTEALFEFIAEFGGELEGLVRGILVSLHRIDVARSADDVASMAVSAALVLYSRAQGWRPGGARPWIWAYKSIREEIVTQVGHPSVQFKPELNEAEPPTGIVGGDAEIDLRFLAHRHERVAAWIGAVEQVANARDCEVHLEYQVQRRLGDPSPAHTVASMFELTPSNVRQIDHRVRKRLGSKRFAALGL